MEAFRDQFTVTELLSYKELLNDEATEEWYTQRDQAKWNVKNATVCNFVTL